MITHLEPDILGCEIKWALGSITMYKATAGDGHPAELFQILKDDVVKVLHWTYQQIWESQQWPQDWKRSIFFPIPKKGNAKECLNYCTMFLSVCLFIYICKYAYVNTYIYLIIYVFVEFWHGVRVFTCNVGNLGSIPGLGRISGGGYKQLTPVFLPGESPWTETPGGLQSMGSQTVGHKWATKHTQG